MKIKHIIFCIFWIQSVNIHAQQTDDIKYNLRFVKAFCNDSIVKGGTLIFFQITPKDTNDFPPVLSMKFTYAIGEKSNKVLVDILKQKKSKNRIQLMIFDSNINEEHSNMYNLIKDSIDIKNPIQIVAFLIQDLKVPAEEKMYVKYGLWEKRNQENRIEQEFEFYVDP